jgi:hypothetical protein
LDAAQRLGVEALGQASGTDEVAEDRGDELAFGRARYEEAVSLGASATADVDFRRRRPPREPRRVFFRGFVSSG